MKRLQWGLLLGAAGAALCGIVADAVAPVPAFAYLDAGTGSLVFQWIIAGTVAGGMAIRVFWGRLTTLFKRKDAASSDD